MADEIKPIEQGADQLAQDLKVDPDINFLG